MVVILASLLCALVCLAGLALITRCACCRSRTSTASNSNPNSNSSSLTAPKGLRKKAIEVLPTVSFGDQGGGGRRPSESECTICLVEFAEGEQLRVLPHCTHGFHVACIDAWLGAHASCPSCRTTISSSPRRRCGRCGATCVLGNG
ncbi:probable E3 ubiquitin-protein ligase ATL44 [Phragmites australis]|uniref:probable E3 ubiquitin-protein ligase ATL44 n=1 Tax=Phragmites australis TaxID=29695 RepID=UPI002D77CB3F|nr:probable E3 ubiquitin-protein ligase ATL44 [Phragmites australis]